MEEFKNHIFQIKIQDGILFIEFFKEFIDYSDIDAGIKKRLEMVKGRSFPILTDLSAVKMASPEARKRMADKDGEIGVTAVAIVIRSKIQRILWDIFRCTYKKQMPVKAFTNKEKAYNWIEKYKQKSPEPAVDRIIE